MIAIKALPRCRILAAKASASNFAIAKKFSNFASLLQHPHLLQKGGFINGKFVDEVPTRLRFDVLNPATGQKICDLPRCCIFSSLFSFLSMLSFFQLFSILICYYSLFYLNKPVLNSSPLFSSLLSYSIHIYLISREG